eukprot:gene16111-19109_t
MEIDVYAFNQRFFLCDCIYIIYVCIYSVYIDMSGAVSDTLQATAAMAKQAVKNCRKRRYKRSGLHRTGLPRSILESCSAEKNWGWWSSSNSQETWSMCLTNGGTSS